MGYHTVISAMVNGHTHIVRKKDQKDFYMQGWEQLDGNIRVVFRSCDSSGECWSALLSEVNDKINELFMLPNRR